MRTATIALNAVFLVLMAVFVVQTFLRSRRYR